MAGIGIITNPYSKKNKKEPGHKIMLGYVLGNRGVYHITESLSDLENVARKFKEQRIEILGINGGDGTIQRTISTFIKIYEDQPLPKIALLRGGTINIIAGNLGIRGSSKHLLLNLVERFHAGEPFKEQTVQTLKCEDQYGFIFTGGFASNFLVEYYKNKKGPWGAVLFIIKLAFSAIRNKGLMLKLIKPFVVRYHGKDVEERNKTATTILASTLPCLPLYFKLFTRIDYAKRLFQFFIFENNHMELLRITTRILFHRNIKKYQPTDLLLDDLTLYSEEGFEMGMDGELFGHYNTVHLGMGPPLTFIK